MEWDRIERAVTSYNKKESHFYYTMTFKFVFFVYLLPVLVSLIWVTLFGTQNQYYRKSYVSHTWSLRSDLPGLFHTLFTYFTATTNNSKQFTKISRRFPTFSRTFLISSKRNVYISGPLKISKIPTKISARNVLTPPQVYRSSLCLFHQTYLDHETFNNNERTCKAA